MKKFLFLLTTLASLGVASGPTAADDFRGVRALILSDVATGAAYDALIADGERRMYLDGRYRLDRRFFGTGAGRFYGYRLGLPYYPGFLRPSPFFYGLEGGVRDGLYDGQAVGSVAAHRIAGPDSTAGPGLLAVRDFRRERRRKRAQSRRAQGYAPAAERWFEDEDYFAEPNGADEP